jgi:hypothetical protein
MLRASNQTALQLGPLERATVLQALESLVRFATESHTTLFSQGFILESDINAPLDLLLAVLFDLVFLQA